MKLLRPHDVMDIAAPAGEEAPILPAAKRYPDSIFGHRDPFGPVHKSGQIPNRPQQRHPALAVTRSYPLKFGGYAAGASDVRHRRVVL